MSEQKNIEVVQKAYAAFGQKDIPTLLSLCSDDIDWQTFGTTEIPNAGRRRGKAEVGKFFSDVAATWKFDRFEPRQFVAQGDVVVSLGSYDGSALPTGQPIAAEFAHVFTVQNGKVTMFREYTDTAVLLGAVTAGAKV